ncbi:efflux RND transporter periplasmic adaptor subunit [Aureivirga marina]|uniref:efflux RND transporter periplasmic adaptor subunit n=1 Tax=Aureivirga marina TaxID=1182451 RepID=UPI0018C9C757|nr:efflux RND transporter periplasmic adaptor subunit [Aureivirga marina]
MKKVIWILALGIIFGSCGNNSETKVDSHDKHEESGHKDEHEDHKDNHEDEHGDEHEEGNGKEVHLTKKQLEIAGIKTGKIELKPLQESLVVTGEIQVPPKSKATVYAPLEAFVAEADLLPGDKVKKGQNVAKLSHPSFLQLQQKYLKAFNDFKLAKQNFDRKSNLYKQEIISLKNLQETEATYNTANATLQSLRANLKLSGLHPESIEKNGIQQSIYVKSPIDGYITENYVNKGKYVSQNEMMYEIIDTDHMHAELQVFGKDIFKVKKGSKFEFKANGNDEIHIGEIELISNKVDEESRTVDVHGHFDDSTETLKSGMYIDAIIYANDAKNVYTVPNTAIFEEAGEKFIFVVNEKEKNSFVKTKVETGVVQMDFTELKAIEGNNFNVSIITKGAYYVKGALMQSTGEMGGHHHH